MNVPKTNNYMQILILAAEITAGRFVFSYLLNDSQPASKPTMPQNLVQVPVKYED